MFVIDTSNCDVFTFSVDFCRLSYAAGRRLMEEFGEDRVEAVSSFVIDHNVSG